MSFVAGDDDGAETNTISIQVINPNSAEDIWINEIHYDNAGTDSDEGVEIAGTAGSVLTNYSLVLYNGIEWHRLRHQCFDGNLGRRTVRVRRRLVWICQESKMIRDGIALVKGTNVIQFLSYDGVLTASNGPAAGMTSVDIGVKESGTTPVGYSLQLKGTGTVYSSFTWTAARPIRAGP